MTVCCPTQRRTHRRQTALRIVPPSTDSEQRSACEDTPENRVRLFLDYLPGINSSGRFGGAAAPSRTAKAPAGAGAFCLGAVTPTTSELSSPEGGVSQRRLWYYYRASTPPPSCLRWQVRRRRPARPDCADYGIVRCRCQSRRASRQPAQAARFLRPPSRLARLSRLRFATWAKGRRCDICAGLADVGCSLEYC